VVFARPRVPQAVGAENPVMSCDLDVLVGDAAELVSSERPFSLDPQTNDVGQRHVNEESAS
jgi:hypothetical protein